MMKSLTRVEAAAWLRSRDRYVILTHRKPDGDTIGSAAALCRGLRAMGKTAHILENPDMTEKYRPLCVGLTCTEAYTGSTVISVDLAAESMFPETFSHLKEKVELAVDHHAINSGYAREGLVDADAAACGEIIYDLLNLLQVPVRKDIAEAIYIAVSTDTGCFRYSNTTARTLRTAASCLEAGADSYPINMKFFETTRLSRLKLNAYMVQNMELYKDGKIVLCRIPLDVEHGCGVTEDDMDNIANFARNIEGVELAVTFRTDYAGDTKLSVRSAPGYNAAQICAALGGGGHVAAAGARVRCGQEEARDKVLEILKEQGYLS